MRLAVINCIILAYAVAVLAEETEEARPRRHLHQIKEMIVNKLFSSSEPNCTQSPEAPPPPPPLETKFFRIPGFNNVVIKAVPKGSSGPAPIDEKLQPNSHIGIVGSYLGTSTLNETYNALLGVKNLLTSGILSAKRDMLNEISVAPPKFRVIATPSKPCAAPLPLEPVRILVKPPRVPIVPTQYSYKQVNQDGSITTHSSSLELNNGVRVTEDGKTLPFIINRVRKIPVRLPVPVLPEVSKIIVSKVTQPISTYAYQQTHQDGRLTSYLELPSLISIPGPVVVTETVQRVPPPPAFLLNRIEKVAAIASFPKAPLVDIAPKPVLMNTPVDHVIRTPTGKPLPGPGPSGYSYSQMSVNGGMTTHSASGVNGAVFVTENGLPTSLEYPNLPEKNPFRHPAYFGAYSYSYNGGAKTGPVNVIEHRPLAPVPVSPVMPLPPNSFSYKQIGDGRMTTYTGSGIFEESFDGNPAVAVHSVNHPVPPPHITDRIEKVAAGAKFNRAPYSPVPFAKPFAVPVPDPAKFVFVPPVHTSVPQRPVKIPTTSNTSPFIYKQIHNDGSMTSYGASGLIVEEGRQLPPPANMAMPFPQGNVRVFESPMYSGPFPMNPVNSNAVKPSTPVSGSYSYKMVNNNMRESHPAGPIDEPIVDTFAAPPPFSSMIAPIQGCVNPDISIPEVVEIGNSFGQPPVLIEKPVPMSYSYKQISHSSSNPFLVVNVEDPVMDVKKVNMNLSQTMPTYQPLAPPPLPASLPPVVHVEEHKPTFIQPAPFVPAPIAAVPVSQVPIESRPSSFSYKQVQNQAFPPVPATSHPAVTVTEHNTLVQPPAVPVEATPPSSFSYKQVTSQANQPLPPPQPAVDDIEQRPLAPATPPMINMRVPKIQKDNTASSFSYKQVTNQGIYEYSDEFPTGIKTNLPRRAPQGNPSGDVYVKQKPLSSSPMPVPVPIQPIPVSPMPVPSSPMSVAANPMPNPKPFFNRRNSLATNPIVVPEQPSFSFKSSNPDGSTITVRDDGRSSIAVHVEEAPKAEESQDAVVSIPPATNAPSMAQETQKEATTITQPENTPAPISGHAKPLRRRVLKRVRPVKHRGDIPEASE